MICYGHKIDRVVFAQVYVYRHSSFPCLTTSVTFMFEVTINYETDHKYISLNIYEFYVLIFDEMLSERLTLTTGSLLDYRVPSRDVLPFPAEMLCI